MDQLKKIALALHTKKILIALPFLIAALVALPPSFNTRYVIFPDTNGAFSFDPFTDQEEGGDSYISPMHETDSVLSYRFMVQDRYGFPYTGFAMELHTDTSFLDLSSYDRVCITIASDKAKFLEFSLKTIIDNYSHPGEITSYHFHNKIIATPQKMGLISIPFKELHTPDWWLDENNMLSSDARVRNHTLNRTYSLDLQNSNKTPHGDTIAVEIGAIYFERDTVPLYLYTLLCILGWFGIYGAVIVYFRRKKPPQQIVIAYKELDVENSADEEVRRLTDCIAKSFSDSELTVEKIARDAGISAARIPVILKKHFQMNFKQYLNRIRISESKRLLLETDRQIVDIAYRVGYNNIPHFNRTFKLSENVSPKEFRKANNPESADDGGDEAE